MSIQAKPMGQHSSRRWMRMALIAVMLFSIVRMPIFSAQSADWLGLHPKKTGEVDSSQEVKTGVNDQLVPPAQRPAPELEKQINELSGKPEAPFAGQRDIPGPRESMSFVMRDGKPIVTYVDPQGEYAGKCKIGDVFGEGDCGDSSSQSDADTKEPKPATGH